MAELARKTPRDAAVLDDEPALLQRWVELPGGRLELLEIPLTPEDFLDPQLEDKMVQGRPHSLARHYLVGLLYNHFRSDPDVMVLEDMKHLLGLGLPGPAPDISVIRGAKDNDPEIESYDMRRQGVAPCLVIEVISPKDSRIRRTDEVDKVALYERAGIREYLLVDTPRRATAHRFRIKGYRLGSDGRYRPIEADREGRLLSEATSLWFGVSPGGDRVEVFDAVTGARLLSPQEAEEGLRAAEAELARLRAEVERLRRDGD
jgi:Uma2 family endonuclease